MNKGKVTEVIGSTLVAEFDSDSLPLIYNALTIDFELEGKAEKLVVEVQQHLGGNKVRAIAMGDTFGLFVEWISQIRVLQLLFLLGKIPWEES